MGLFKGVPYINFVVFLIEVRTIREGLGEQGTFINRSAHGILMKNPIDTQAFVGMRKELRVFDQRREDIIKQSRDVLKNSKRAIFALHRKDKKEAASLLAQAEKVLKALRAIIKKDSHLASVGAFGEGLQEYVEAKAYQAIVHQKPIPTAKQLEVDTDNYLMGLCDVSGELVRRAINAAIEGDDATATSCKEVVATLYAELLQFDFRNSPLRRKFDSVKYDLQKLEDVMFQLKLKKG